MTIKATVTGPFIELDVIDDLTMDDLQPLFDAFSGTSRGGPFVVLTDTTRMRAAPRPVINAFGEGLRRMPSIKETWLGDAVVCRSPSVRFVISTLLIVAPMPTQVMAFDDRFDAVRWCAALLRRRRVAVPPQMLYTA